MGLGLCPEVMFSNKSLVGLALSPGLRPEEASCGECGNHVWSGFFSYVEPTEPERWVLVPNLKG